MKTQLNTKARKLYSEAMALLARAQKLLESAKQEHEKRTRKQAA